MSNIISASNNITNMSSMNFFPGDNLGLSSFNQKKNEVAVLETDNSFIKYLFNQRDKIAGLKTSNNFTKYPINQKKRIAVLKIDNKFTGVKYNNIPRSKRLRSTHKKGNKRSYESVLHNLIFQGETTRLATPESTTIVADSIYPPRFKILMNLFNDSQLNSLPLKETDFYPEFLDDAVQVIDQMLINLRSHVHPTATKIELIKYDEFVAIIEKYRSLNIQQDPQRNSKIRNIMKKISIIFLEYFALEKSTTITEPKITQSTTVPETTVKQTKLTAAISITIPESTTTTEPKITQSTTVPEITVKQTKLTAATSITIPESTTTTELKITQSTTVPEITVKQRVITSIVLCLFATGSLLSGIFMFYKKRRYKHSLHLANNLETSQRQGHTQV